MSKLLQSISRIDGVLMKRPAGPHPNPLHWKALCEARRKVQNNQCATCPASGEHYRLEGHHRHYDNWGAEVLADIVLLCPQCHDAITSRIRYARFARGDQCARFAEPKSNFVDVPRPKYRSFVSPPLRPEQSSPARYRPPRFKVTVTGD